MQRSRIHLAMAVLSLCIMACEPQVRPIDYGQDACDYCRMSIVEDHYGSELLTTKGKAYKFDSIECLAAFVLKERVPPKLVYGLYFTDVEQAGILVAREGLHFVQAKKLKSPMGLNLSAYASAETAASVAELYFGSVMSWGEVLQFVESAWLK